MILVRVQYHGKEQRISVAQGSCIEDVLQKLGINRETVLVSRNKEIVPETERVEHNDRIVIMKITSSG
jgi:sulfur carrier protein ThiS